ncbi:cytochrome c oxidase subunit II [Reinekea marina]|uniref:Cytochrome c oxidase subunit 2 n=1 Tax=Reinekea marina TaxID=1310421 RepID=A0ABV7WSP3_9GAMM|nr:cytochrome c oxidase subunit II [Reinekea marina]MBU2864510.1 cytochrome c oxidase subunit II [Reinekea forsetii]MDN3647692.1 cytochrome c oxidase subunit II [Reinekea marina]
MPFKLLVRTVALLVFALSSLAHADWELNMPRGVTDISADVYGLHMLTFWVCVVIGILVFGVMFYAMFKHRKSKGAVASNFHESTKVELLWTIIPTIIIVAIGVRAFFTLEKMYDFEDSSMTVEVVGYQWKWRYTYLDENPDEQVSFFSTLTTPQDQINNLQEKSENYLLEVDEPLVLPVGTKVRFVLSSADVIHSWWVPQLAVKKDAIPGIVNESWTIINEPGTYRGQCTELCGKDHGFMPVVVIAKPQAEFDEWLAGKKEEARKLAELTQKDWTFDELMTLGESVYQKNCASCHQANGEGVPGVFPGLKGSPIATGAVFDHLDVVINGSAKNPAMSAFGAQLSEVDLAAVITYERNAWGNDMGDMVTPVDVLNFNSGQ